MPKINCKVTLKYENDPFEEDYGCFDVNKNISLYGGYNYGDIDTYEWRYYVEEEGEEFKCIELEDYTNLSEEEHFQLLTVWEHELPLDCIIAMQKYIKENLGKVEVTRHFMVLEY